MAKFKVGDKVRRGVQVGIVKDVEKDPYLEVKFDKEPVTVFVHESELVRNSAVRSTNAAVQEAINSACARNSAEVEVSLQYAARVQQAMRDAVRMVSGVRQSSTNTLYCPDDDAAEEVVEILTDAGVPKNEVWINARKVWNASVAKNNSDDTQYDMEAMIRDMKRIAAWNDPKYYVKSFIEYGKLINDPESWNRPNPLVPDNALASATQALAGVGGKLGDALATIKTTFPTLVAFYKAYKKVNNL